jgi:hypothetical protein
MRIAFICASLERGMDGVGDYTRLLAGELVALGHHSRIIALNDRHVGDQIIENHDQSISIVRFGIQISWKKRMQLASELLQKFSPDWVSLQYVSFGFHPKGIPILLPSRLGKISKAYKWHLMFHELWNGANHNSKLSHCLLGLSEKRIVFGLLKQLKPQLCTTSNQLYHQWLNCAKIDNQILPLFSNIRSQEDRQNSSPVTENTVAIFGQLESEELGRELISTALKMADGRPLHWRVLGLAGPKWENVLRQKGISFYSSGMLGEDDLSLALRSCRFGLASTNIYRIGKSGSVLAMLENGLPLLVGRSGWVPRHSTSHLELPDGCLGCWFNPSWDNLPPQNQSKKPPSPYEVARRFVSILNAA